MNSFFENREVFLMSYQDLKGVKSSQPLLLPSTRMVPSTLMPFQP